MAGPRVSRDLCEALAAVQDLLQEVRQAEGTTQASVRQVAEPLRETIELLALQETDQPAAGFLSDSLTALVLSARASTSGNEERAKEYLEQAELFLEAARQALEGDPSGEESAPEESGGA